jgi:hypothetical protein
LKYHAAPAAQLTSGDDVGAFEQKRPEKPSRQSHTAAAAAEVTPARHSPWPEHMCASQLLKHEPEPESKHGRSADGCRSPLEHALLVNAAPVSARVHATVRERVPPQKPSASLLASVVENGTHGSRTPQHHISLHP